MKLPFSTTIRNFLPSILLFTPLYSFGDFNGISQSFISFEYYNISCVGINLGQFGKTYFNDRLEIRYPPMLPFHITIKDRYNSNKPNLSLSAFYSFLLSQYPFPSRFFDDNFLKLYNKMVLPASLAVSTYHFFPKGYGNIKRSKGDDWESYKSWSIYVKNDIDINVFNKNNWTSFCPGIGASIRSTHIGHISYGEILFNCGLNYNFHLIAGKLRNNNFSPYILLSLIGMA